MLTAHASICESWARQVLSIRPSKRVLFCTALPPFYCQSAMLWTNLFRPASSPACCNRVFHALPKFYFCASPNFCLLITASPAVRLIQAAPGENLPESPGIVTTDQPERREPRFMSPHSDIPYRGNSTVSHCEHDPWSLQCVMNFLNRHCGFMMYHSLLMHS